MYKRRDTFGNVPDVRTMELLTQHSAGSLGSLAVAACQPAGPASLLAITTPVRRQSGEAVEHRPLAIVRRVSDGDERLGPGRRRDDSTAVREFVVRLLATVGTSARVADTTELKGGDSSVSVGVVNRDTTGTNTSQNCVCQYKILTMASMTYPSQPQSWYRRGTKREECREPCWQ